MFINTQHETNLRTINQDFPPANSRSKIVNFILAVPSIYDRFQNALAESYSPIDCIVYYLDEIQPLATVPLDLKDEMLLQLGLELFNGTSEMKRGTFRLYESTNVWNDMYIALFYAILQMARPNEHIA